MNSVCLEMNAQTHFTSREQGRKVKRVITLML